ncbi:hypothetical protein CPB84DRAFT_1850060 [Gymnopilus junonius]|uniref:Uncharacterized protein n=1 Tax=Gymnopilus junonius TaxID=109634 RepID=A0A9P5TKN5_GYMJU|nr:hypothetical protein CPB84DRAFT_1850060 [Gymnopilus junonius]
MDAFEPTNSIPHSHRSGSNSPDRPYPESPAPFNGVDSDLSFSSRPSFPGQPMGSPIPPQASEQLHPKFLETLVAQLRLTPPQAKGLHDLSSIASTLGGGLRLPELATSLYLLASFAAMENRLTGLLNSVLQLVRSSDDDEIGDLRGLFRELVIRLEDTFHLTKEQSANVQRVTQDLIIRPTRTGFKDIHLDVLNQVCTNPVTYSLDNVIGRPAREALLNAAAKRIGSSVRNSFCQELRDSILGSETVSLTKFTTDMIMKYRLGNLSAQVEQSYVILFAILMSEGLSDLLVAEEPEDDVSLPEVGVSPSDDSDVHKSQQARTQAGSKRGPKTTKTTKAGRVPDGEDFWSRVDKWFEEEIEKRGKSTNFAGPAWKGYVDETIHQDNEHFNCPASARQGGLATSLSHQSTESMLSISQLNTPAVPHSAPMFSSQPSTSNPGISFAASPQQQFSFMQTGMPSLLMAAHGQ